MTYKRVHMTVPEQSRFVAIHEAGHFVVAEELKFNVLFATRLDFCGRHGLTIAVFDSSIPLIHQCTRKMAGAASERLFSSQKTNLAEKDFEEVEHLSAGMVRVALNNATKILKMKQRRLDQVVEALLLHGHINGSLQPASDDDIKRAVEIVRNGSFELPGAV
jgi:hypothetical protein